MQELSRIPIAEGVPYHTIMGTRDATVDNASSHLEGAQSELKVTSDHNTNNHPEAIAEIVRILYEHLER